MTPSPFMPTSKPRVGPWKVVLFCIIWPAGLFLAVRWIWRSSGLTNGVRVALTAVAIFLVPVLWSATVSFFVPHPTATSSAPTPAPVPSKGVVPSQAPSAIPTRTGPEMDTFTFDKYGVTILVPKGWTANGIADPDGGAMITGPDPDSWSAVLVAIGTGKHAHRGTPAEQLKKALQALKDGGQKVMDKHVDGHSYEIRANGSGLISHEYLYVAKDRDFLIYWTYEKSAKTELGPQADWSINSFAVEMEARG